MTAFRKLLGLFLVASACAGVIYGGVRAKHSGLFALRAIQIETIGAVSPWSDDEVQRIMNLPTVQKEPLTLFDIDLRQIEKNLLDSGWIDQVSVTKRFPNALGVKLRFKTPVATLQRKTDSELHYVDSAGEVFGPVNLLTHHNVPHLSGDFGEEGSVEVLTAIELIHQWRSSKLNEISPLSSVIWGQKNGYRILTWYPIGASRHRTLLELGFLDAGDHISIHDNIPKNIVKLDSKDEHEYVKKFNHVHEVFGYLSDRSIQALRVFIDIPKKVVVKTL